MVITMLRISKKAQLYGLSIFIYAIAIAIILIIGLVGLTREIEVYSHAGLQRHQAMTLTKNAEMIRTLIDQERTYAVDRALLYTAAFGGYSTGDLLEGGDASCGVRNMNIEHVGEKGVPYWINENDDCIPGESKLKEVFRQYMGFFEMPKDDVVDAVSGVTGTRISFFNFYLARFDFNEGMVQTKWYPRDISFISFQVANFNYETSVHSQIQQSTRFHELFGKSEEFAEGGYANYPFNDYILRRSLPQEGNYGAFGTLVHRYECCNVVNCDDLSDTYDKECTIHAERNPTTGKLENFYFRGGCARIVQEADDEAIRCVLETAVNRINNRLGKVNSIGNDISHRYEIFTLNLTYEGSVPCGN